jgi:preprotein translocase subunit SecY
MKGFIDTVKNIWRIEELRKRILITLGLLLVYRIGSFIVLPGVDSAKLASGSTGGSGLVDLLSIFTGGAFTRASIFALGVMPYISASIIMQLAGIAIPAVQKMQREESGRRRMNQWTRYITILISLFQAPGYILTYVDAEARPVNDAMWMPVSVIILTCSTLFVMWLGERITERGLGNGTSLIIMIGILARLPESFIQEFVSRMGYGGGGLVVILMEVVFWLLIIAGNILLVQGTRRIPVQFAKRVQGNKQYGGVRNYVPLKVNAAGVMPIIFAQAIVLIPMYLTQIPAFRDVQWMARFSDYQSIGYNVTLFLMVVAFTYFYTAITVNPNQLADDMKRNGGFIPGVKPGKATAGHIDELLSRITLPGAIFLGIVAILPAFAGAMGIKQGFAQFFGGTSLLIMVGVLLDTLQQIESHLLMRHYDGLMKTGRIKGRQSATYSMATG